MTYWGGPGYQDEPVDPNPVAPPLPPGWGAVPHPGYLPPGYPAPAWSGYGAPPDPRPATATTAAVLACVLAGLVLLEGVLLLVGASVIGGIERSLGQSNGAPAVLGINGALNLAVGGGLIAGAALLLQRRPVGRVLLAAGNLVAIGESIYWTAVSDAGAVAVTLLHAALAVVGLGLAFTVSASSWLTPAGAQR